MAPRVAAKASSPNPAKKSTSCLPPVASKTAYRRPLLSAKSAGGGGAKKKLSAYNKFMRTEMARLKETDPNITHKER